MASKLVPERPLLFSPTLAATIGLEEAILLQVMMDFIAHRPATVHDGFRWVEIPDQELMAALPFWKAADVRRVESSLRSLGMMLRNPQTGRSDSYYYALNERTDASAAEPSRVADIKPVRRPVSQQEQGAGYIPPDWQPGAEWLSQCRQHNIPDSFTLSLVPEFVAYWRDRGETRFSWGNTFCRHVRSRWREEETSQGARERTTRMHRAWQPSPDAVAILVNAGIPEHFIEDAVPEFILYWQERGIQMSTWNTRFIDHIRRQWDRYSAAFNYDSTPRPIPADWQPSSACFEILQLAEIDEEYARGKVPEFVLYWQDSGQARPSWNTVFLQFIKQDWARRLTAPVEVESGHGQHRTPAEESQHNVEERLRQLGDRSWAEKARHW